MIIFRTPKDGVRRKLWIELISKYQQYDFSSTHYLICERHFMADDFNDKNGKQELKSQAAPTIFCEITNCDEKFTQPQVFIAEKKLNDKPTDDKVTCNVNNCQYEMSGTDKQIIFFK